MKQYDMIVIGTGAGNIILEKALERGLSCAQIEKGKFGGTCLTRGCIPTKVMTTAADRIRDIQESFKLGIETGEISLNWQKLSERVWKKIDESKELKAFYKNHEQLDVYEGEAYFLEDKVLQVKMNDGSLSEPLRADKIFIGVGGRTNVPDIKGLEEAGYITSETLFGDKYPEKPYESLIIIGGGAIGTEFAHIFASFGTKVSVIQRNVRLLPKEEEEVSKKIMENFSAYDIKVHLNKDTVSAKREHGLKILTIRDKTTGEQTNIQVEEILVCPGIISNADSLMLENTSIKTDERGWIPTDNYLQTNVEGIWAFGDVNGKQQFRHKANYEADIIADNIFAEEGKNLRYAEYSLVPAVTFTYPQVAHVGLSEKQALEEGYEIQVGRNFYSQTAKGYALGYEEGLVCDGFAKLIIDKKNGDMLGIHIIGKEASVLIQPFLNLMVAGKMNFTPQKLSTLRQTMVPHPALSEVAIWTYYYLED